MKTPPPILSNENAEAIRVTSPHFHHYADNHPERCNRIVVFYARVAVFYGRYPVVTDELLMFDVNYDDYDLSVLQKYWLLFANDAIRSRIDYRDWPNYKEALIRLFGVDADMRDFNFCGEEYTKLEIPYFSVFVGVCCEAPPETGGAEPTLLFDGEVRGLKPAEFSALLNGSMSRKLEDLLRKWHIRRRHMKRDEFQLARLDLREVINSLIATMPPLSPYEDAWMRFHMRKNTLLQALLASELVGDDDAIAIAKRGLANCQRQFRRLQLRSDKLRSAK